MFAIKVLYDSNDKQYNTVKLIEYSSCSNGINYSTSGNSLLGYLVSSISFSRALFSSSLAHHSRAIPFQFYLFSIYYFSLGHINEQNIFPIMRQYARPYFGLFNFAQIKRKWHFYSFFPATIVWLHVPLFSSPMSSLLLRLLVLVGPRCWLIFVRSIKF